MLFITSLQPGHAGDHERSIDAHDEELTRSLRVWQYQCAFNNHSLSVASVLSFSCTPSLLDASAATAIATLAVVAQ